MTMVRGPRGVFVGSTASGLALLGTAVELGANLVGVVSFASSRAAAISGFADFGAAASRHGLESIVVTDTINEPDVVAAIAALEPDVLYVMAWPQLLKRELLAVPTSGVIGRHNALLPARRGRAPVAWALIHGLTRTGVSLFWMDEGVDSGDLIAQREIAIAPDDYPPQVLAKIHDATVDLLRDVVPALAAGRCPRTPQDHALATYTHPRRPDMGLIDWEKPAPRLYNFVRGLSHPYPGAFTYDRMRRVNVWRSTVQPGDRGTASPGRIHRVGESAADVQTGDGVLRIALEPGVGLETGSVLG